MPAEASLEAFGAGAFYLLQAYPKPPNMRKPHCWQLLQALCQKLLELSFNELWKRRIKHDAPLPSPFHQTANTGPREAASIAQNKSQVQSFEFIYSIWNFAKSDYFWLLVTYLGSISHFRSCPFTFSSVRIEFSDKLFFSGYSLRKANLPQVLYFITLLIPSLRHCGLFHFHLRPCTQHPIWVFKEVRHFFCGQVHWTSVYVTIRKSRQHHSQTSSTWAIYCKYPNLPAEQLFFLGFW